MSDRICSMTECTEKFYARGYCRTHYAAERHAGRLKRLPGWGKFWSKVDKSSESGCWLWTAGVNNKGYPVYQDGTAHRLSYRMHHPLSGDIGHLSVCHRCDTPRCVNPAHLFLASHAENMADMSRKGRSRSTRLTPAQVVAIRNDSRPSVRTGMDYGVSGPTVRAIRLRLTWKHVA